MGATRVAQDGGMRRPLRPVLLAVACALLLGSSYAVPAAAAPAPEPSVGVVAPVSVTAVGASVVCCMRMVI